MRIKLLAIAIAMGYSGMSYAGAIDRSGQSIAAFLEPGNYVEASISGLVPKVNGTVTPQFGANQQTESTGEVGKSFQFYNFAFKAQVTDHISMGILYDEPFGADSEYELGKTVAFSDADITTAAEVKSRNLSFLMGYQPTINWNLYGGPVYQTNEVYTSLGGTSVAPNNGYILDFKEDSAIGWLAGLSYQIPEIALRASLTYRSEIEHEKTAAEVLPAANPASAFVDPTAGITKITTPQSINLDLQSGIAPNTLAFLNLRWVNWSDITVRPDQFGQLSQLVSSSWGDSRGYNMIEYYEDQYSLNAGLAHKFTEKWTGMFLAGWDSGVGSPIPSMGPVNGYWSTGLGFQYSPQSNYFIMGAVNYFDLDDVEIFTGNYVVPDHKAGPVQKVADFDDNYAIGYMMKIGYKF